ncbi:MAG: DUF4157 domain-containing protein [Acidimicrobiales bacterium]
MGTARDKATTNGARRSVPARHRPPLRSPMRPADALHALQRTAGNRVTSLVVQAKLMVGHAADASEREADRVAAAVLRTLSDGDAGGVPGPGADQAAVRRSPVSAVDPLGGTAVDPDGEAAIARARTGGTALGTPVRARMERAFGADFSAVRLHVGPEADTVSRSLQARAFTTGPDVFFSSGAYQPATRSGESLLAHELTHVVQQGAVPSVRRSTAPPVGGRRSGRVVRRAMLAVDGPSDGTEALAATRNCLANLKEHKRVRTSAGKVTKAYPAGDARGQVYGPAGATPAVSSLTAGSATIGPLETLYFLGRGSMADIAGLTPRDLARNLAGAFAAYPGTFVGGLKIVACYSASGLEDGTARAPTSYADRARTELDARATTTFRPRFVEGIRGIAWADEETGQRVGYQVLGATGQAEPAGERVHRRRAREAVVRGPHRNPTPPSARRRWTPSSRRCTRTKAWTRRWPGGCSARRRGSGTCRRGRSVATSRWPWAS